MVVAANTGADNGARHATVANKKVGRAKLFSGYMPSRRDLVLDSSSCAPVADTMQTDANVTTKTPCSIMLEGLSHSSDAKARLDA
jgi:hypothetical protein